MKNTHQSPIEPFLRRDLKRPLPTNWPRIILIGLIIALGWLVADILIARAQSVLTYSELREEAIWSACEEKLRSL